MNIDSLNASQIIVIVFIGLSYLYVIISYIFNIVHRFKEKRKKGN